MANFTADLTKFVEKTKIKIDVVIRKVALQALRGVVLKTAVLTGRLRGNWRVAMSAANLSVQWDLFDKGGEATIAKGATIIATTPKNQDVTIYITNNLPYAQWIEDGHSKKAPQGMLKITFVEVRMGLEELIKSAA